MSIVLEGKTIVVISPQSWGKMFISKHHYAIELAKRGNDVYFLNPPEERWFGRPKIDIYPSELTKGLYLINHGLWFPYSLKFHVLPLFHGLMKIHIRRLLKAIGHIDIVWSFDLGHLYPFRFWGGRTFNIFHPVDEPQNDVAIDSAKDANIIFSVTREILDKYKGYAIPRYWVNHGVASEFLVERKHSSANKNSIRVGVTGNFLRKDLDWNVLIQIMEENPDITFECWGSFTDSQSNIGGAGNPETIFFVERMQSMSNVILHGPVPSRVLAEEISRMDAFLICYDVQKDQSRGTNYHKIIEFLSTGKVVISNNVTTYEDRPDLVTMVNDRENNIMLPALFRQVVDNLELYNSCERQVIRRSYAFEHSYAKQLDKISNLIQSI